MSISWEVIFTIFGSKSERTFDHFKSMSAMFYSRNHRKLRAVAMQSVSRGFFDAGASFLREHCVSPRSKLPPAMGRGAESWSEFCDGVSKRNDATPAAQRSDILFEHLAEFQVYARLSISSRNSERGGQSLVDVIDSRVNLADGSETR
jgi:hypothetical protein